MTRFTFEPLHPDGSPRRHAGTWRPPYHETFTRPGIGPGGVSGFGGPLWEGLQAATEEQLRERYTFGFADRPLYHLDDGEEA